MKIYRFFIHLVLLLFVVILVGLVFRRPLYAVLEYLSLLFLMLLWLIPSMSLFGLKKSFTYFREAFIPIENRTKTEEASNYFKMISIYIILGSIIISGATACYWFVNLTNYKDLGRFIGVMIISPIYAILAVMAIFLPLIAELKKEKF